jgi:predicted TIM-barrel fold metal-dependent hydrolase
MPYSEEKFPDDLIDMHVHVGIRGDGQYQGMGHFSEDFLKNQIFDVFLMFAHVKREEANDDGLIDKLVQVLYDTKVNHIVCLALDHYFDPVTGKGDSDRSKMWVANEFITDVLQQIKRISEKILFGASVNPNDRMNFERRTRECVEAGAVLMKWVPSSQGINLADAHVRDSMIFLASAGKGGKPLPLLLHVGPEHSIPPPDEKMLSYDFLSWNTWDRVFNIFRRWHKPDVKAIRANIEAALNAGATIIFAHCGTPYFKAPWYKGPSEHSDFDVVSDYLRRTARNEFKGKCYADISAFVTPMRKPYFEKIKQLPEDLLLFGSDYPNPVFELSAGPEEWWDDLKHIILDGQVWRLVVPEDNLLDANYRELRHYFGEHPLFSNAHRLLMEETDT